MTCPQCGKPAIFRRGRAEVECINGHIWPVR